MLQNCHTATIKMQSELIKLSIFSQPAEAEPWQPANVHYFCHLQVKILAMYLKVQAEYLQCIYECRIFATYLQVHNTCSVSTSAGYLQCTGSVLRTIPKFAAIIWATAPGQLSLCAGAELSNNNAMRMSSDCVFRYCCIQKLVSSPVCCVSMLQDAVWV